MGKNWLLFREEGLKVRHLLIWYPGYSSETQDPAFVSSQLNNAPDVLLRQFVRQPSRDLLDDIKRWSSTLSTHDSHLPYYKECRKYLKSYFSQPVSSSSITRARHTYLDNERVHLQNDIIYERCNGRNYILFCQGDMETRHMLVWYPSNARGFENPDQLWIGLIEICSSLLMEFIHWPTEDMLVRLQIALNQRIMDDKQEYYYRKCIEYLGQHLVDPRRMHNFYFHRNNEWIKVPSSVAYWLTIWTQDAIELNERAMVGVAYAHPAVQIDGKPFTYIIRVNNGQFFHATIRFSQTEEYEVSME